MFDESMVQRLNECFTNPYKYKIHHVLIMKYLLQWLFKWLSYFLSRIRKNIKDADIPKQKVVDSQDIFTCTSCTEPLNTIHRFKDKSFCFECRQEIDSCSDSDSE